MHVSILLFKYISTNIGLTYTENRNLEANNFFTLWTPNYFFSFMTLKTPLQSGKVLAGYLFIYVS